MARRGSWKPTLKSNVARYGQSRLASKAQRKAIKKKLKHVLVQDTPPPPKPNWKDQFIDDCLNGKPVAPTPPPKSREERQQEARRARFEAEEKIALERWAVLYPRIFMWAAHRELTLDQLSDTLGSAPHFLHRWMIGVRYWGSLSGVVTFPYPHSAPTLSTQRRFQKILGL